MDGGAYRSTVPYGDYSMRWLTHAPSSQPPTTEKSHKKFRRKGETCRTTLGYHAITLLNQQLLRILLLDQGHHKRLTMLLVTPSQPREPCGYS